MDGEAGRLLRNEIFLNIKKYKENMKEHLKKLLVLAAIGETLRPAEMAKLKEMVDFEMIVVEADQIHSEMGAYRQDDEQALQLMAEIIGDMFPSAVKQPFVG